MQTGHLTLHTKNYHVNDKHINKFVIYHKSIIPQMLNRRYKYWHAPESARQLQFRSLVALGNVLLFTCSDLKQSCLSTLTERGIFFQRAKQLLERKDWPVKYYCKYLILNKEFMTWYAQGWHVPESARHLLFGNLLASGNVLLSTCSDLKQSCLNILTQREIFFSWSEAAGWEERLAQ